MRVDFASSWDTNDADPQDEQRESTWNKTRLILIGLILLFLLSLGMLIAGSVMLGIGVHKSNETPPSCPAVAASPYYATLLSTQISYSDVLSDYAGAVATVTAQIRSSLTGSSSNGKMMQLDVANTNPLITILGLSPGDGNVGVMAVSAIVYTSQDSPSADTVTKDLSNGKDLTLYHIEESQPASSADSQMCSKVSVYYNNTDSPQTPGPTTKTTVTKATPTTKLLTTPTITPQHCTCPPVTECPTNAPATTPTTKSPPSPSTATPQNTQSTSTAPKATSTPTKATTPTFKPTPTSTVPPVTSSTKTTVTSTTTRTTSPSTQSSRVTQITTSAPSTSTVPEGSTTKTSAPTSTTTSSTLLPTSPVVSTNTVTQHVPVTSTNVTHKATSPSSTSSTGTPVPSSKQTTISQTAINTATSHETSTVTQNIPVTSTTVTPTTPTVPVTNPVSSSTVTQKYTSTSSTSSIATVTSTTNVETSSTAPGTQHTTVPQKTSSPVTTHPTSTVTQNIPVTSTTATKTARTLPSTISVWTTSASHTASPSLSTISGPETSGTTTLGTSTHAPVTQHPSSSSTNPHTTSVTHNIPATNTTVTQTASSAPVTSPASSTTVITTTHDVTSTHPTGTRALLSTLTTPTASITVTQTASQTPSTAPVATPTVTQTAAPSSGPAASTTVTTKTNTAHTSSQSTTVLTTPAHGVPTSTVVTVNTLASATSAVSTESTPPTNTVTQTVRESTVTPTVPVTTPTSTVTVKQTTPTTTVLPSCQPVTTQVPIDENKKDIVVLIDDSSAVRTPANYNLLAQWLVGQLFKSWPVDPSHWEVAPVQYAQLEYNILMDFDENNLNELTQAVGVSVYSGRNGPSITKGLRSTVGLNGRDYVSRTTILISASSNATDVLNAQQYAYQLNSNGGQVITLAVGGADGEFLAMLSAGPSHYFTSPTFSPSQQIADQITALIKGPEPATTTSTTPQPSTATPLPDLPCHPDVAIIFDRSWAVGSDQEFQNQINFIADNLTNSWNIAKSGMETELVIYSARTGGSLAIGTYSYTSSAQFSMIVHGYSNYWDQSEPLISGALQYTSSVTDYRRQGRSVNTILFTYSSDYNDIANSLQYTSNLGNLIIISMGQSSPVLLTSLTGNVVHGVPYGTDMVQQINTMLCNPSTPVPLPTTSQPASTQTTTTTIQPTSHTVVTRKPCADCNPSIASIVVAVDAGVVLNKAQFASELSFVSGDLQNGWNHFERFGIVGFDDDTHTQVMANFGDIMTSDEYSILVNAIVQQSGTPSLTSAMKQILRNFVPNPVYGAMNTLLFTSTQNPTDISNALAFSKQLRSVGSVIIVGLNMQNTSLLASLTNSPADVIEWPDVTNDNGIADKINQRLSPKVPYTTVSPLPYSSTVQAKTSTQPSHISSTVGSTVTGYTVTQPITTTGQPFTPSISCGKDLILLIDQSNAIPDQKSFDKLKSWLMTSLVPLWPVSPDQIAVAPFGYANKTWTDVGGDFTENSANEVNILLNYNLFYQPTKSQGLVKAIQRTSQIVSPRPGAVVIVISAYDNATDVSAASAFADSMKENGRIVITLGVGTSLNGNLKMLSSGPSYYFTSSFDFPTGDLLAQQISQQICNGSAPIIPTTQSTPRQSTQPVTTPLPTSFPCLPDAAILLDNSAEQTIAEFGFLVHYISSTLVSDWQISPNNSEAELISADATIGIVGSNPWQYQSLEEFQEVINAAEDDFYGGKSSITALISYLSSNLPQQPRKDRPLTAILFTHTSEMSDISKSVTILASMPPLNLIAVGLGQKVNLANLQYLTGNAIIASTLDNNLKLQIDSMMCSPTTPAVLTTVTTVTPPKVSTSNQPITSPQTTVIIPTTTVTLDKCYNCYPQEENILIIMDNSMQDPKTYAQQQYLISQLISNWNHLERIAFGYYSSSLTQSIGYMDLRSDEPPSVLQQVINAIGVSNKQANIQHAMYQARSIIPIPEYGAQKTVFFTTTSDPASVNSSLDSAHFLQSLGSLTVVGVALPDNQGINQLASPGMAIAWNNLDNTQDVIGQIMGTLTSNNTLTTVTSVPPSTIITTPVSTQTTVTSATNCDRDVLLLVDQSNAVPDQASFDKLKYWLTTSLVPKWQVSPDEIAVAPYGFANKTWTDVGGDFLETSVAEVNLLINNNLLYMTSSGQGLTRALEKASQTATPHGAPAVILISAYDNADDVTSAGQYADSLKANGATVITLAVGSTITGNLKNLASGDTFAFSSTDFAVSDAFALQISEVMCSTVTRRPRTSTPMITTTAKPTSVLPTSFACLPDAAVLLDNSGEQSEGEFNNLVHYISSTLVSDWQISPNNSEAALISANAVIGIVAGNAWKYRNLADFQENINAAEDDYYGGKSSITALISYLNSNLPPTRPDRPLTAVLFTYTSVMSDINKSITLLSTMSPLNLIIVGLGQKVDMISLQYLTGNVIIADVLDNNLKQQIDQMMCNPTTPAMQTSTTKAVKTTTASSPAPLTSPYQSTTAQPVTTVTLDKCANCYPQEENILVIMDNSAQQDAKTYAQQQSLISQLISNWNHLERIAFGYYSSSLTQSIGYMDLRSDEPTSILQIIVNSTQKSAQNADIAHALYQSTSIVPLPGYGVQKTVFFTTTSDSAAIQKSLNSAHFLQSLGSLTVVGVALPDNQGINQLASSGMAIAWNNLDNTQDVIAQIMGTLNSYQSTASPVTVPSTPTGAPVTQTSQGTSVSTVTPVINCDRDVILLIDQSNAIPDQNSFNQMITWITQSLTPKWPVSPNQIAVAPFGFANKTWSDVGGNFEENSATEVNLLIKSQLFYLSNVTQGLTRAMEKASQTTTPHGAPAVILISAYDGADDVTTSGQYSDSLKANGATVITLAIGASTTGNLGTLSSGPTFALTSKDFVMSDAFAVQITESICDSVTRKPTSTVPMVTSTVAQTTVLPTSFPCLPDTALLVDNSNLQTNQQFKDLIHYISSSLVSDWLISPTQSEAALIVGNARFANTINGGWEYQNLASFQNSINSADDKLYGGASSIYSLLTYYNSNRPTARDGHPANAILFTYSSDPTDISKSINLLSQMDAVNLMVVGLGGQVNADLLKTLSENTVIGKTLDTQLKNTIDSMMCNPTSPLPPVTVGTTTAMPAVPTSTQPSFSTIATSTIAQTTAAPFNCPDCYPQEENILLIMDDSAGQDAFTFAQQKSLLSQLVANWNHLERISFGFYSNSFTDNIGYENLLPSEKPALLQAIINSVAQSTKEADIAHALYQATSIVPLPAFGLQKTVFFTTTADPSAIQKSQNSSAFLQSLGSMIVVGVALPVGSDVTGLASPGMALAWNNVNDTQTITQQIINTLGGSTPPTGASSSVAPVTSPVQTSVATTGTPVCKRDVMLLLDESNSIPDDASFNKLKSWVLNTLLKTFNLGPIRVLPVGYATQDWNDMMGGSYDGKYGELDVVITNMYNRSNNKAPNMTYALRKGVSALSPDGPTTVILISTSSDTTDIASAAAASSALKTNGNDVITLGIGFRADKLQTISSGAGFSFASSSYDIDASVAASINSVICSNAPTPSPGPSTTPQSIPFSSAAPVVSTTGKITAANLPSSNAAVQTSTAGQPLSTSGAAITTTSSSTSTMGLQSTTSNVCTRKVILLMDDSNAIDNSTDFDKLSHWITSSLLPQLLPSGLISVLPIGYASNDFNDIMGGEFSSSLSELKTVITPAYIYQSKQAPNMTRALQKTLGSMPQDSATTVILISASSDPTDVQSAVAAAVPLKTNGNQLITMGIGFTSDKLQIISSGASFAFASADYSFKLTLTQNIVNAVCPNGPATTGPPSSSSTSGQTNAATSTVQSQTTATLPATSKATVTQTGPPTAPAATTQGASSAAPSSSAAPTAGKPSTLTTQTIPGIPTTSASPCARNIIILMDESNAIPNQNSFSQLQKWITNSLLPTINLSVAKVLPIGYAKQDWNNFMQSHYDSSIADLKNNITNYYQYRSNSVPDMADALEKAALELRNGVPTTVLLISASQNAADIAAATTAAMNLKSSGNDVITLGLAMEADLLQSISSGVGFSFTSPTFIIKLSVTEGIANALCATAPASPFSNWET